MNTDEEERPIRENMEKERVVAKKSEQKRNSIKQVFSSFI